MRGGITSHAAAERVQAIAVCLNAGDVMMIELVDR
jgi:hypothetical protein